MNHPLIDTDWLKTQYKGNVKELLNIYRMENDECLERIKGAMEDEDYDDVRAVAHKMKGSSRIIGAFGIEKLAINIEATFDSNSLEKKVSELEDMYAHLKVEIGRLLHN